MSTTHVAAHEWNEPLAAPVRRRLSTGALGVLRVYLWKETRDHGAALVALALFVTVACAGILVGDPRFAGTQLFAFGVLIACQLLVIVVVAFELVPGERQRGTMALLARVPGGLAAAFWAKATFLLLCVLGASLFAFLLVQGATRACIGRWNAFDGGSLLEWAVVLIGIASWTLAVSCWLPRAALGLPTVLLFFALLAAPFLPLPLAGNGILFIASNSGLLAVSTPIALLVAWASLVHGPRTSGGGRHGARETLFPREGEKQ